jgi:hypothetical protein
LLALNTAAAVGLYKFLFTRGPLWKIWNAKKPAQTASNPPELRLPPEQVPVVPGTEAGKSFYQDEPLRKEA